MGFFSSLFDTVNNGDTLRRSVEADEDDIELQEAMGHKPNYRKYGLDNTDSNNGWYTCVKCGRKFRAGDMDIDHILPQSRGGGSNRGNLQCICKHCNRSKRDDTSDTEADLRRRRKELYKQDIDDIRVMNEASKISRNKKKK